MRNMVRNVAVAIGFAWCVGGCAGEPADGALCPPGIGGDAVIQGEVVPTGVWSDLALVGDGFFVLSGDDGGELYTRDGRLTLDGRGRLVSALGRPFLAHPPVDGAWEPAELYLPAWVPARATRRVRIMANLDADAPLSSLAAGDPWATAAFSTTTHIFDVVGGEHSLEVFFAHEGQGSWHWVALVYDPDLRPVAEGWLSFDEQGRLAGSSQDSTPFVPAGASTGQLLELDFGRGTAEGGSGLSGMSQFASASSVTWVEQDGHGAVIMASTHVDTRGVVVATFSDGRHVALGRLAVARFEHPDQLVRVGEHLFAAERACGGPPPTYLRADDDGGTYVWPAALEDLSRRP